MKPKEPTYQVALNVLALTTCYPAFLITAEVLVIYMHQFWATVTKHKASYRFKIDNKRFFMNVEVFREILNICPKVPGKEFNEPPTDEEALSFIRELGHSREIRYITDVVVDHLHQPRRTFASIINKYLCGKEGLAYQIDNIDSKKQDKMFDPRFMKIIIHHFLTKDKSISLRNKIFMHTARDDSLLGTMRFISRHADSQVYGAILPEAMTNQALQDSIAYKTYYAITSGVEPPQTKKSQKKPDSAILSEESPSKKKPAKAKKDAATKPKPSKKKVLVKADTGKGLNVLSELALSEGDSDEEEDDDEHVFENESDDEGDDNDSEDDNNDDDDNDDDDDKNDDDMADSERTESFVSTHDEEKMDEEEEADAEELYKDLNLNLRTEDAEMTDADRGGSEQPNVSQKSGFEQIEEDAYVTLTVVHDKQKTDGTMQSSFVSPDFISKLPNLDNTPPPENVIASLMDTAITVTK
ncbi:hypothetical protein Tco_1292391 [Tanacetum coccineum]